MVTRRDDARAKATRLLLCQMLSEAPWISAVIFDRTSAGGIAHQLKDAGSEDLLGSRVTLIRQEPETPLREVWSVLAQLEPRWTLNLHDDDVWAGVPSVPVDIDKHLSLLAPNLLVKPSDGGPARLAKQRMSQHALFGAVRPDVFADVARYVAAAPAPVGGEDRLLLRFAEMRGDVGSMGSFDYLWSAHNWHPDNAQAAYSDYLEAAGWIGPVSGSSMFLLVQALDDLAIVAHTRTNFSAHQLQIALADRLRYFWPFSDSGAQKLLRFAPTRIRHAVIASRDQQEGWRKRVGNVIRMIPNPAVGELEGFERWALGVERTRDLAGVLHGLLPELRKISTPEMQAQIDYWEGLLRPLLSEQCDPWTPNGHCRIEEKGSIQ